MSNEIVGIKPSFFGISLDFRALWKSLMHQSARSPVAIVAKRFVKLFEEHGISVTQIPRFVPQLSLASLQSPEKLLASLTPELLSEVALLFGVQRAWLEGTTDSIYDCDFCYKAPERFFNALSKIANDAYESPACFLFDGRRLDREADYEQPLALVMREKIAEVSNEDIFKYRIFQDTWNWTYDKCRLQLKAMVQIVEKRDKRPIRLYPCSQDILANIRGGVVIPRRFLVGRHEMNAPLGDYVLSRSESVCAKEIEELPQVAQNVDLIMKEEGARKRGAAI